MTDKQSFLIQSIVQELVLFLIQDYKMTIPEAFGTVYNSTLYDLLIDTETGLYYQSAPYVYSYLQNEIKTGTVA